jgi:Domain of unknown function (DUF4868)
MSHGGNTAADSLEELRAILLPGPTNPVTIFLHADRPGGQPQQWRRIRLSSDLETEFRWALEGNLSQRATLDALRPYSFDGMLEGGIGYWSKDAVQAEHNWPYVVPGLDWQHVFDGDETFFKKVDFLVSVVPVSPAKRLICYRRQSSNTLAKKGRFAGLFDPHEHILRKPTGPIFQLDYNCDFFEWDGWIFVLSQRSFESLTHISVATQEKAGGAIDRIAIVENLEIENIDEFREAVLKRTRSARRLATAEQNGILESLTVSQIEQCLTEIEASGAAIPIDWEIVEGRLILRPDIDNGSEVDRVIEVLVDYFTRGLSSRTIYATDVKHRVG